jgi:hypothetical protein
MQKSTPARNAAMRFELVAPGKNVGVEASVLIVPVVFGLGNKVTHFGIFK